MSSLTRGYCLALGLSMLLSFSYQTWAAEINLDKVLELTAEHSPALSAARFREISAAEGVGVARAGYLPTLDFEAIDSTGFPGSSGLTGVGGLMGSPYRSGPGYGVVARQNIWDFGRTSNAVSAAKHETGLRKEDTKVTLFQVKQAAVKAYIDCARFRTLKELWAKLGDESQVVAKEVGRFVKTGQRSVVELSLVESQTEEAITASTDYSERMLLAIRRISILTGLPEAQVSCRSLDLESSDEITTTHPENSSPIVSRAMADVEVAEARLNQSKAGHYPKVVAVASVGDDAKARLVGKQEYSLAVGFILPLFDGLKTTSEVSRAQATLNEKEQELEAAKQRLDELNTNYDESLRSSAVRKHHLKNELKLANQALGLAKRRYFLQQGSLIDFRESLRNLSRVRTQLAEAVAESIAAARLKALLY